MGASRLISLSFYEDARRLCTLLTQAKGRNLALLLQIDCSSIPYEYANVGQARSCFCHLQKPEKRAWHALWPKQCDKAGHEATSAAEQGRRCVKEEFVVLCRPISSDHRKLDAQVVIGAPRAGPHLDIKPASNERYDSLDEVF